MTDELMRTTDKVLVRNATWLDGSRRDLRIQDGLVEEISATELSWDDPSSEIDATGHVILPGLVDAHCHLDKTLFGRDWVPHAAEDTLASRISTDRRLRSELGLPDLDAIRALLTRMVATGTSLVRTHTDVDPEVGLEGIRRVREAAQQLERVVRLQQVAFPQHGLLSFPGTAELLRAAVGEGATAIGGLDPTADGDPVAYLDLIFDLADREGTQVDLHLHSHGDVGLSEIDLVIERTQTLGMQGRVAISHAYCLGELDDTQVRDATERLAGAGVGVVIAAPYSFPVPPIRTLMAAGVTVACGHDGIRDLWGPYGTGDMLDRVRHIASRSGFRRDADIQLVLEAATSGGRRLITQQHGGIVEGEPADFLLVPASCPAEAVVTAPPQRTIIRGSRV